MTPYGPPANGTAFPRSGPPPFRGPPPAFSRGGPPLFRPPLAARGVPPLFAFRGPPPAFQARGVSPLHGPPSGLAHPPLGLNIPPSLMATPGFPTPPSPATSGWTARPGAPYYCNAGFMERNSPKWMEYKDEATGAFYYFNTVTKETVWDQPEEFRMQKAREQVAKMTSEALHATSFPMTTQVQAPVQLTQESEQGKSGAVTEKEEEEEQEELKQQEIHDNARKKRKEEQERAQAATFENMQVAERLTAFKQFLEDKQITPTLKWGDAQRLIGKDSSMHSDPRWKFALTTVGEKKQAFAEYCTQAKNRATIEKRRLVKKTREQFIELLGLFESTLAPPSRRRQVSWEELAASNNFYALRNDPRWSAVEEIRERQQLFATFMQDLERNQKARLAKQRDAIHRAFTELLRHRVDSKQVEFGSSRSSKRLDTDSKRRVLDLLKEVELPECGGKVGDDALRIVDRHDVYNWAEELLHERRDLEHAKRKRERADRMNRQEKLSRELNERFKDFVAAQKLTAGSTWEEFSAKHLQASEEQTIELKSETNGDTDAGGDDEGNEDGDDKHLHWKEQRRIFEKYIRRLRRDLEPVASVIRKHLDRRGDPPLRVTEATSYAVFIDALKDGVGITLDNNAPEEGEEKMIEETNDVMKSTPEDHDDGSATGEAGKGKKLNPDAVDTALETTVNKHREMKDNDATVEFPLFVRQVYEMWIALAKEDCMREKEKKHRKRSRKESRNLAIEDDGNDDRPCRSRRRSSALEELEDDENIKKRRSHRSSRKRRRSHGSPSVSRSRSRSRSVSRRESSSHRRSRNRSRDRESALPPGFAAVSSKPIVDSMTARQQMPSKPLSEAEEAAKAEEIIRQARLKLLAKTTTTSNESELEDGEELEEGEEGEE